MLPYSTFSPQTAKGNRICGQSITLSNIFHSFIFTFFSCQCEEPFTGCSFPEIVLYWLPTDCSSSRMTQIQICIIRSILHGRTAPAQFPMGGSSAALLFSMGSSLGLLLQGPSMGRAPCRPHCCPMGSSMATHRDLTCVVLMGCKGAVCSSTAQSWAAGSFCSVPGSSSVLLLHRCWCLQGSFCLHFPYISLLQLLFYSICSLS